MTTHVNTGLAAQWGATSAQQRNANHTQAATHVTPQSSTHHTLNTTSSTHTSSAADTSSARSSAGKTQIQLQQKRDIHARHRAQRVELKSLMLRFQFSELEIQRVKNAGVASKSDLIFLTHHQDDGLASLALSPVTTLKLSRLLQHLSQMTEGPSVSLSPPPSSPPVTVLPVRAHTADVRSMLARRREEEKEREKKREGEREVRLMVEAREEARAAWRETRLRYTLQ